MDAKQALATISAEAAFDSVALLAFDPGGDDLPRRPHGHLLADGGSARSPGAASHLGKQRGGIDVGKVGPRVAPAKRRSSSERRPPPGITRRDAPGGWLHRHRVDGDPNARGRAARHRRSQPRLLVTPGYSVPPVAGLVATRSISADMPACPAPSCSVASYASSTSIDIAANDSDRSVSS